MPSTLFLDPDKITVFFWPNSHRTYRVSSSGWNSLDFPDQWAMMTAWDPPSNARFGLCSPSP